MNFTDLKIVVNGDRARRGRRLLSESEWSEYQNGEKNSKTRYETHPEEPLRLVFEGVEQTAKFITAPRG
jgi:hypothetical protein